jgi:hypothetical protein
MTKVEETVEKMFGQIATLSREERQQMRQALSADEFWEEIEDAKAINRTVENRAKGEKGTPALEVFRRLKLS